MKTNDYYERLFSNYPDMLPYRSFGKMLGESAILSTLCNHNKLASYVRCQFYSNFVSYYFRCTFSKCGSILGVKHLFLLD